MGKEEKQSKKGIKRFKNKKKSIANKPEEKFPGLSSTMVEFSMKLNYFKSLGDCITSCGSTNEMPKAEANSTE